MNWIMRHPLATMDHLGYIPSFLSELDPAPAAQQIDGAYCGGWNKFEGFTMRPDGSLKYSGDPAFPVLAETRLRDETIRVYDCAWVAIVQPDGTFEVARLD